MKKLTLIILSSLSLLNWTISQETRNLNYNSALRQHSQKPKENTELKAASVLSLPFFEDFANFQDSPYPDKDRWIDDYAFINHTYPDSAISIGVATLDAFDQIGELYAENDRATPSDTLTSLPIDISSIADSVFIHFYFQRGGKSHPPNLSDTLILEVYNKDSVRWEKIWHEIGIHKDSLHLREYSFFDTIVPLNKDQYSDSLQFRFRNYTSISKEENFGQRGTLSNDDHWHLDYIQINSAANRDEFKQGLHSDIAFTELPTPSLKRYNTLPWTHLENAQGPGKNTSNYFEFRVLYDVQQVYPVDLNIYSRDLNTGEIIETRNPQSVDDAEPGWISEDVTFISGINYNPAYPKGKFEIVTHFNGDRVNDLHPQNDTSRRIEIYEDYYAYDDGSAELGFDNTGTSSYLGYVLNRYKIYRRTENPDTLKAIEIFFNRTQDDFTQDLDFRVCVWKYLGAEDDGLLYISPDTLQPNFDNAENPGLMRIPIKDVLLVSDTIYVGIQKLTDEYLNIGYDVNYNNVDQILIRNGGRPNWYSPINSVEKGSLMIRPVFGNGEGTSSLQTRTAGKQNLTLYPNPVSEELQLGIESSEEIGYRIIDLVGTIRLQGTYYGTSIYVGHLPQGMYLIQTFDQLGRHSQTGKFIKTVNH